MQTHNDEVLDQIKHVERHYKTGEKRYSRATISRRTKHFVFDSLVLPDGIPISLTLVLLAAEVLDGFIIEQAVGMDTTSDLKLHVSRANIETRRLLTMSRSSSMP